MTYDLLRLKGVVCPGCSLEGRCDYDVKCNSILEIEEIFFESK